MNMKSTRGGTSDVMGDIDDSSSLEQITKTYQPTSQKDPLSYKDIDETHGGISNIVHAVDGAASSTTMTTHSSSCPTAAEMGIN